MSLYNLLNLALDFLLVTAPDLGTFEDPVLVTLHDLPSWCSHWQSGQNSKLHLGEEQRAFWKFWLDTVGIGLGTVERETLLGLVHRGQWTSLSPGFNFFASSTNNFWRIIEGDTIAELDGFLSLFPELGERGLKFATSCITLRGEASLDRSLTKLTPAFSRLTRIIATKFARRSSWNLTKLRAKFQNWDTWLLSC